MPIRPENKKRYPANWVTISRTIRFVRAQGRCECHGECGRGTHEGRCPNRHGGEAYSTGSLVVLTTAHLDHTPENCDPSNLRAMCQGCHLHYDRDHHRETAAATRRAAREDAGQLTLDAEPRPPTAREITERFHLCATPGRHPDECLCPVDGRDVVTVPGLDRWADKEQQ